MIDGRDPGGPDRAVAAGGGTSALEPSIARLLTIGTYLSIALLAIGFVLLLATGLGPRSSDPGFDIGSIPADVLALRPIGFIALGLVAVVATPAARVLASMVGYARRGERDMVLIAALILAVIAASVTIARVLEG